MKNPQFIKCQIDHIFFVLCDWFLILIIISHLDMGLSDYQNAKKMCFFIGIYLAS